MEKLKTAYSLIMFVEKFSSSSAEDKKEIIDEELIVKFWSLLGDKIKSSTDSSLIAKILHLGIVKPLPPKYVLMRLFEMTHDPQDLCLLSLRYPAVLHIKSSMDDELPLHSMSRRGCHHKRDFESMLLEGVRGYVGGIGGFGGLCTENKTGQTPISLLFANVISKSCHDWNWMCSMIQLAVEQSLKLSSKDDASIPVHRVPLLHAALNLVCPPGLINRLLPRCDLNTCDSLGRTPLLIAVEQKNTSYIVIKTLIRKYPAGVRQKDKRGNLPLHLKIKAGSKTSDNINQYVKDFDVIATIVQESPESLEVQDFETKLPPFMLASVNKWSLDVVYGLLRTSPWVISSYSSKD